MTTRDASPLLGTDLFVGYVPAFRGVDHWKHVYRMDRRTTADAIMRRVILENISNRDERLLVDVTETASQEAALESLKAQIAETTGHVTEGPASLGTAFQSPKEVAHAIYFQRANLAIWVFSCGREHTAALPWADRISADLNGPPAGAYDSALTFEPVHGMRGSFHYSLKWTLGNWGWFKFQAQHGALTRGEAPNTLSLIPGGHAAVVHGWAQEPGRETYQGSITLATIP